MDSKNFSVELRNLINKHSIENGCNTPDFILVDYMLGCLHVFGDAVNKRVEWYGGNKYKFALERIRSWTCNDGRTFKDPIGILENIDDYLNKVLYATEHEEAEIQEDDESGLKILIDWRKDKNMVNLNTGQVTKRDFRTICEQFLDVEGYDVVKREIAKCPNPECGGHMDIIQYCEYQWYCVCEECQYTSPMAKTESEAIRLHNLVARGVSHV